ncbi:MAG: zinc-ribbon domain-containing protein, partial [Bacilli bacterium]|nr:zinc-ribbon domain-containing protein [Bacilli bacterium]
MKCSKCGNIVNENDSFCSNCGVSLSNSSNKYSRAALKEDAKKKISKPLMLLTLI